VRIVADTNVLVLALLVPGGGPRALLAAADAGEVTLVASAALLSELGEVLSRHRFRTG
jgi:predicted nucleic acid-binding protein